MVREQTIGGARMTDGAEQFAQAAGVLPAEVGRCALALPEEVRRCAEEIRLRLGRPPTVTLPEGERPIPGAPTVTERALQELLERAGRWSLHTVLEQVRRGYLTLEGGHRLGLCGTAVTQEDRIIALRELTSADLRIARHVRGGAAEIIDSLYHEGRLQSTLIAAPPGAGKTTLLRDLICTVSDGGAGRAPLRVAVADERGELAGAFGRQPLGAHTDVLTGCPKATAVLMLLRAMSPQVVAVDEITVPEDVRAMEQAMGCGAVLLATAHGGGAEDLYRRPLYREMMTRGIFRRVVTIRMEGGRRLLSVSKAGEGT